MKRIIEAFICLILLFISGVLSYWAWGNWKSIGYEFDKDFLTYQGNLYCYLFIIGILFIFLISLSFLKRCLPEKGQPTEEEKINKRIRNTRIQNLFMGLAVAGVGWIAIEFPRKDFRSIAPGAAKFLILLQ